MEPRDRPSDTMDRAECAACGRPVPIHRIRVLARRDDLAFAEVPCAACGSVGLAMFVGSRPEVADAAAEPLPTRRAITFDDVLEMHRFLEAWTGDARSLVEPAGPGSSAGT